MLREFADGIFPESHWPGEINTYREEIKLPERKAYQQTSQHSVFMTSVANRAPQRYALPGDDQPDAPPGLEFGASCSLKIGAEMFPKFHWEGEIPYVTALHPGI
jgi:hypothetical protein